MYVTTAAEMRQIDKTSIELFLVPEIVLMETNLKWL